MAVATLESTPFKPILARTAVRPEKKAELNAKSIHKTISQFYLYTFCEFYLYI
jgi:hypothetical protein